jgi:D-alanyl-D-alanine carboxypeptidase, serine-type, PBP4 family
MNAPYRFLLCFLISLIGSFSSLAETPLPIKRFLSMPEMRGASFSIMAKDVDNGEILYRYDEDRSLTPASVLKLVTTATALEILGAEYQFKTTIEYDGTITDGVLEGNLYIHGGGDPTLGSEYLLKDRSSFNPDNNTFIPEWISAVKQAGIRSINGRVISDESIYDSEGVSRKWLYEDMGSYYAPGSYGLSVFDNMYKLYLRSGSVGSTPSIIRTSPRMTDLYFINHITSANVSTDSSFIMGAPFSDERRLYGVVPVNRNEYILRGDIPDPALFLAGYFTSELRIAGIDVNGEPSCYRLLKEYNEWSPKARISIATTLSPTLEEIARITNEVSHNLYADALLKAIGLQYKPEPREVISSTDRGIKVMKSHWEARGLDTSSLFFFDGSGLAVTDKLTTSFVCDMLVYMTDYSDVGEAFIAGIPQAGRDGSVRNFLRGTSLEGNARLKSGGMSAVRGYAGYIKKGNKTYSVAIIVNTYTGAGRPMVNAIERLLVDLF